MSVLIFKTCVTKISPCSTTSSPLRPRENHEPFQNQYWNHSIFAIFRSGFGNSHTLKQGSDLYKYSVIYLFYNDCIYFTFMCIWIYVCVCACWILQKELKIHILFMPKKKNKYYLFNICYLNNVTLDLSYSPRYLLKKQYIYIVQFWLLYSEVLTPKPTWF